MLVSESGELTALPFTAVITSPATRLAEFAGVPQSTPRISVPELAGAMVCGTPAFWSLAMHVVPPGWPPPKPLLPWFWA